MSNIKDGLIQVPAKVTIYPVDKRLLPQEWTQVEKKFKIGAAFLKKSALSFEEEAMLLPDIIKIKPTSEKWEKAVSDYWANISLTVPETGYELEVGFKYPTEEAKLAGESLDIAEKMAYGYPINAVDYIMYRYCLVYGRVANSIEDIYKSPKIMFYLEDENYKRRILLQNTSLEIKAMTRFIAISSDVETLTRIAEAINKIDGPEFAASHVTQLIKTEPKRFLDLIDDKNLSMRAFIMKAINKGIVKIVPGTEILQYGETRLGVSLEDAIQNMIDEKMSSVKDRIKATIDSNPIVTQRMSPKLPQEDRLKIEAEVEKTLTEANQKVEQANLTADEIIKKALEEAAAIKAKAIKEANQNKVTSLPVQANSAETKPAENK